MGENASQIEREIIAERAELGRNLDTLETKARDLADWRVHYRNHPGVFLGAAVGAGVVLGALSHRRVHESFGYVNYAHPPERPEPREPRTPLASRFRGPKARRLVETWEHITDALLAVATAKAVDVVSDYLPGFGDEYRRHAEHGPRASNAFWQDQPSAAGGSSRSGADARPARSGWEAGQDDLE
jgi:hypothetical protein